jgi:hypothetical protein
MINTRLPGKLPDTRIAALTPTVTLLQARGRHDRTAGRIRPHVSDHTLGISSTTLAESSLANMDADDLSDSCAEDSDELSSDDDWSFKTTHQTLTTYPGSPVSSAALLYCVLSVPQCLPLLIKLAWEAWINTRSKLAAPAEVVAISNTFSFPKRMIRILAHNVASTAYRATSSSAQYSTIWSVHMLPAAARCTQGTSLYHEHLFTNPTRLGTFTRDLTARLQS